MLDLLFTGAASTTDIERRHEVIATNLANLSTAGYKGRINSFNSVLDSTLKQRQSGPTKTQATDFTPGSILATGNDFDFALGSPGFFAIEGADGARYFTRNGNFSIDSTGRMVTRTGETVLGDGGPIVINPAGGKINVTENGQIFQGDNSLGTLKIVDFDQPDLLDRISDSFFTASPGATENPVDEPQVQQGYQEQSNVNMIKELVSLIGSQRSLDASYRVVRIIDRVLGRIVAPQS